jgi:NADH-quinone oxidoreductase subunit M
MLFLAFFASFAVKMPMWPVHTWLPDAHVQAPTAGSVVLAAILLKMGGYGFLRFSLPMFPVGSDVMAPLVLWMSAIAIVYTSLVALAQTDMKKLIAYSSVAHMGFVTMGIFAANQQGVDGAIFQMISHGFISGALFLCVGVIYDRMHTREIDAYGGLVNRMPAYALVFMFFTMANVGLAGDQRFRRRIPDADGDLPGQHLGCRRGHDGGDPVGRLCAVAVPPGGLWRLIKEALKSITDMDRREKAIFAPLIAMTLILGVYPSLVTDIIGPSVTALVTDYQAALPADAAGLALNEGHSE